MRLTVATISSGGAMAKPFCHCLAGSLPISSMPECFSLSRLVSPILATTASISALAPVKKNQPGRAEKRCAYSLSTAGVSTSGSTLIDTMWTCLPSSALSSSCTLNRLAVIGGQMLVQVVNMKLMSTTLPLMMSS